MRIELMYSWAVNNGRIIGRETLVKGGISDMHTGSTLTLRALPLVGIAAILSMAAYGQAISPGAGPASDSESLLDREMVIPSARLDVSSLRLTRKLARAHT